MARTAYGARLSGCSGTEIMICGKRSTADRIRRVARTWTAQGGWTGARTLYELAQLAGRRRGTPAAHIGAEFASRSTNAEE